MEVVLDSNILLRTLISAGDILDIFVNPALLILAPLKLKEEFIKHEHEIKSKSALSSSLFDELKEGIFSIIKFVPFNEYKQCISKAKELLGTHTKDEDFVALAISKGIKIWTYESLIFRIGLAISTKELSKELNIE